MPETDRKKIILYRQRKGMSLSLSLGTLLISLIIIFAFFMVYNRFLVDSAIGNLEQSLSRVGYAQSVDDMKSMKFFLDDLVVSELGAKDLDAKRFTSLEFSKNITSEAKDFRQIRDVKFMLEDALAARRGQRAGFLQWVDRAMMILKGWFGVSGKLSEPGAAIRRGREFTAAEKKLYEQAKEDEGAWHMAEAIQAYEKLIQQAFDCKDLVDLQLDLSYAYMKVGNYDKAQSLLFRVQNQHRGSREEGVATVLIQRIRGFVDLAQERDALLASIGKVQDRNELQQIYIQAGLIQYRLFELDKAEQSFMNAATIIPDNQQTTKALFYLGIALKFHAKYDKAIEVFRELVERFPRSEFGIYGRYQLAESLRKTGDYEKAAEQFKTIAVDFSDSSVAPLSQFKAGYTYFYDVGDPLRAQDSFETLRASYEDDKIGRYSVNEISPYVNSTVRDFGFILLQKRLYKDARDAFEEAIRQDPKDIWGYSGYATALAFLGEKDKSVEIALSAVKMGADEYTIAALGYIYELNRQYFKAIEFYEKALKIKRKYPSVLYNLGRLYEIAGKYDNAIENYQKMLAVSKKASKDPEVYINLGHAYWYRGDYQGAEEQFKKAVELKPDSALAHYNLATAYQAGRKNQLAAAEYRKVLKLDPSFRQAQVALDALNRRGR